MNSEELDKITSSFKEKLGDDSYALISDDIGILLTKNAEVQNNLNKKDEEIQKLTDRSEKLIRANGSLLQQVSMGIDKRVLETDDEDAPKKSFNFKDAFDEKGRFKSKM